MRSEAQPPRSAATTGALTFDSYLETVRRTANTRQHGMSARWFALQALFGEIGSIMSEVKKRRREGDTYFRYPEALKEEVGDALWYLTHLGDLLGTPLVDLAAEARRRSGTRTAGPDPDSFADLQPSYRRRVLPLHGARLDPPLRKLAMGVAEAMRGLAADENLPLALARAHLVEVLAHMLDLADIAGISLGECAEANVTKVLDRWPGADPVFPSLLDENEKPSEQLPRRFSVHFAEDALRSSVYVVQRVNGVVVGDRLTDNMHFDDGYRFHDCFHLAYAAILGWSPVLRSLLRCKRKTNPKTDEVEDGQRAAVVEEGVSAWLFNCASERKWFAGARSLDYDLLKEIRRITRGFEVEKRPLWLWERAILQGFTVFRELHENKGGWVDVDLEARTITYTAASARPAPLVGSS